MAIKQAIIVADLGPGEGGKGGVAHKVCCAKRAHTVIKVGGGQGSHGVRTSRGERFDFSHFGCGTFEGVRTHISHRMVIDPGTLLVEGEALRYQHGVREAFDLLTVDGDAVCSTPFHLASSCLRELARKGDPRGTVGTGMGEAWLEAESNADPSLVIRAKELGDPRVVDKLEAVRQRKLVELFGIIEGPDSFLPQDCQEANDLIASLRLPAVPASTARQWQELSRFIKTVDRDYLRGVLNYRDGVVVVESSHGALNDRYYGFHPHTTKLRTVPYRHLEMIKACGYDGEVRILGITRAYQIRHGAGPMVTEDAEFTARLDPGSYKEENRWQGRLRAGPLDLVALRYAINVCGGPQVFNGLAVTWFDQVLALGKWPVCHRYEGADDPEFFTSSGEILVRHGENGAQLDRQYRLGQWLLGCRPAVKVHNLPEGNNQTEGKNRTEVIGLCRGLLEAELAIPVKMVGFGPTEDDKILI